MPDFTKGKWNYEKNQGYPFYNVFREGSSQYLASVNTEANARLIAAAPEMYNALKCVNGLLKDPRITGLLARIDGKENSHE